MSASHRSLPRDRLAAAALVAALSAGLLAGCADASGDTTGAASEPSAETASAETASDTSTPDTSTPDTSTPAPVTTPPLTPGPTKPPAVVGDATTPAGGSLYAPGDIDPGLQPWIDEAVADLAGRLGLGADAISVSAAVLVTWPDSSLGCPQPGMEYLQVLTDGAVIELVAGGEIYRYHAGEGSGPFLCATPITTAPAPSG
jgi:hypothetical protein